MTIDLKIGAKVLTCVVSYTVYTLFYTVYTVLAINIKSGKFGRKISVNVGLGHWASGTKGVRGVGSDRRICTLHWYVSCLNKEIIQ